MSNLQAVIFDLDGTILDTLDDLTDSVNYALTKNGLASRTKDEIRSFVGNGVKNLLEKSAGYNADGTCMSQVRSDFKARYSEHNADKTKPYDGITGLLEELRASGIKTAVVSNKTDDAVKKLAEKYFPGMFDVVIGERIGVPRKPGPDSVNEALKTLGTTKEHAVYIGDSEVDVKTAENAELEFIAVTWGFRTRKELRNAGAVITVDDIEQLKKILKEKNSGKSGSSAAYRIFISLILLIPIFLHCFAVYNWKAGMKKTITEAYGESLKRGNSYMQEIGMTDYVFVKDVKYYRTYGQIYIKPIVEFRCTAKAPLHLDTELAVDYASHYVNDNYFHGFSAPFYISAENVFYSVVPFSMFEPFAFMLPDAVVFDGNSCPVYVDVSKDNANFSTMESNYYITWQFVVLYASFYVLVMRFYFKKVRKGEISPKKGIIIHKNSTKIPKISVCILVFSGLAFFGVLKFNEIYNSTVESAHYTETIENMYQDLRRNVYLENFDETDRLWQAISNMKYPGRYYKDTDCLAHFSRAVKYYYEGNVWLGSGTEIDEMNKCAKKTGFPSAKDDTELAHYIYEKLCIMSDANDVADAELRARDRKNFLNKGRSAGIPVAGMYEDDINKTPLGSYDEKDCIYSTRPVTIGDKVIQQKYLRYTDYYFLNASHTHTLVTVRVENGKVTDVGDFRDNPEELSSYQKRRFNDQKNGKDKTGLTEDELDKLLNEARFFDTDGFSDAEDFYEFYIDDFYDYEEAEEYFNSHS